MTPQLSLITGTVNRPDGFWRLLESVIERTCVPWEMIVGDGSDKPGSYTRDLPSNVLVIEEHPRKGHVKGYNAAFRKASGEWIIWLNDDAEVCDGYDINAIQFMESHPKIGLGALHYSENGGPFHVNSAWQATYANFGIFRKALGEKVGFFDEELMMYGGDNSLAIRILIAGYGVADIPTAKILHHSENDPIRRDNQKYKLSDNRILTKKYMPLWSEWLQTFRRHQIDTGTIPWSHGVEPERVRA